MTILRSLLLLALALPATQAQTWSQPVREVQKEARSAVAGHCNATIAAGYVSSGYQPCNVKSITGADLGGAVPAGKVLVVEEVSATCFKAVADGWQALSLTGTGSGFSPSRTIPLAKIGTTSPRDQWVAFAGGRLYLPANAQIVATLFMGGNATLAASCAVSFSGHLVDAQ